ncbi:hypothetical protein Jden_1494 [Jonesia denitrificans DSM 20603]|uniref:Uncharacterized protein n=1 Tax=Jonesia denitrificans (strain ATCC 14870 / DSM 20603 / BCRC 15368 / CIP 55.134 / JCM 11481 / NBRC 15587 / NCTC 10816 / Prevot 55134) TaxID=471856 RepID=C7R4X3_JONDD|nr:hypothetical protein Jden_1494 [Jonesia denitrificans DSM 20603]SQH21363.1 Uncharacterised protein [Jonesia denitrificans]
MDCKPGHRLDGNRDQKKGAPGRASRGHYSLYVGGNPILTPASPPVFYDPTHSERLFVPWL